MRKFLASILIALALLAFTPNPQSSSEIFALINGYRASNGLYALEQDSILMQLAQGQSDYQASIQQITHGGPGGTRPRDRAYAAGYGGGAVVFISELVTGGGSDGSPQSALNWWQNSPEHNGYLLSSNYFELGVGVATDGDGRYYYTAVLGNIASGTTYVPPENVPPVAPQPVMVPVVRAEPRDNGAIVHIVRQGQALWTIAAVYEVPLETILQLNNLTASSFIFPGDEIIVAPPGSVMPLEDEEDEEPTATQEAVRDAVTPAPTTPAPTATPQQVAALQAESGPPQPNTISAAEASAQNNTVLWIVGAALVSILSIFIASFFIKKQPPPAPPDNDPFAPLD
jgi:LysM repeat protein